MVGLTEARWIHLEENRDLFEILNRLVATNTQQTELPRELQAVMAIVDSRQVGTEEISVEYLLPHHVDFARFLKKRSPHVEVKAIMAFGAGQTAHFVPLLQNRRFEIELVNS